MCLLLLTVTLRGVSNKHCLLALFSLPLSNTRDRFSCDEFQMSREVRKPTFWFPTWSDTNQAVQLQKMARGLKFRILEVEGLYYPCSENKGPDQFCGYREADLRLCFRICKTLVFS